MKYKILITILWFFPKTWAHKILYYINFHEKLNLEKPTLLNEKVQWMIVNYFGKKEANLTDKQNVKDYIQSLSIKDLIIPKTYFVLKRKKGRIHIDDLPEKFVLKTNHGSGDIFICANKCNFDLNNSMKRLYKLCKKNFAKKVLEYHYSYIEPLIMCEEFLDDKKNSRPIDYKFFCYNGYVDSVMVCSNRERDVKLDFYDENWNHLDYSEKQKWSKVENEKPKNLDKMFRIASEISKGFPFVRVDLYNIEGKIYFGEMTFTPAAGLSKAYSREGNIHLGSFIDIEQLKLQIKSDKKDNINK